MTRAQTNDERWEPLLGYLRRARARETFDEHERGYRLDVAQELREVLALAADGGPWRERLERTLGGIFRGRKYDLTDSRHRAWLRRAWSSESFERALASFGDQGADPIESFRSFAIAVEPDAGTFTGDPDRPVLDDLERQAFISFASLFNFACSPLELPVVRPDAFDLLEQTLGYEWSSGVSTVERYRRHLAFADDVARRLADAGVELRDMADTQSLIQIGGLHADFWASDPRGAAAVTAGEGRPADARTPRGGTVGGGGGTSEAAGGDAAPAARGGERAYLSICAVYRDVAPDLREWIEFHRVVGVERFFLYDNLSADDHREVLAPYVEAGIASVRPWPVLDGLNGQITANEDCLRWHRHDSRWIAFLDLDEFLFSPTGRPLPEVLPDYERWPGVVVSWAMFGFNGHRTRPDGLVVESYTRRIEVGDGPNVKSIVDPTRVGRCLSTHHFAYPYLSAVDEDHFPVDRPINPSPSYARLRLNHYHRKSEQEYVAKCLRKEAIGRPGRAPTPDELERMWQREEATGVDDDTILAYLPRLREALGGRPGGPLGRVPVTRDR